MKPMLMIAALLLLAGGAWAQKGKPAPNPNNLTQFGFTADEAKAAQADFKAFEQGNRDADGQSQGLQAQRSKVLLATPADRTAFEALTRQLFEIAIGRDLARFDLVVKWRATYGADKSRTLEGILRDAAPGGPGAPPPPRGK